MYTTMNLGTLFVFLNLYFINLIGMAICFCLKKSNKKAARCYSIYSWVLSLNAIVRLLFEAYFEISISVLIGLSDFEWSGPNFNSTVLYSNLFTIMLLLVLFAFSVLLMAFYLCRASSLDEKKFKAKIGDLYNGLVLSKSVYKRWKAVFYLFFFCIRRLIFAFVCIAAEDDFLFQIYVAIALALVNLSYLVL